MTISTWQEPPPTGLAAWSREAEAAARIASSLAPTPFIPLSLRVFREVDGDKVYDPQATAAVVVAALLTGQELGLQPMASLRAIDVVNGTPALRAITLRALVLQRGHDMWLVESTNTRCVMRGQRAGSANVQEVAWDMDRARALGLAGKENWRKQPRNMLVARATAELARLIAPEAILGLPYTAEELADGLEQLEAEANLEPPAPPKRTTARRNRKPAEPAVTAPTDARPLPDDEPPLDDDGPPPEDPDAPWPPDVRTLSRDQLTAIHAAFTDLNVTDRDDKLAMLSGILNTTVASSQDLTSAQASTVLDALTQLLAQRAATAASDAT